MIDPIRGILIEGFYYNYVPGSFREARPLKNSTEEAQSNKVATNLGIGYPTFTTTLVLENNYDISSELGGGSGNTQWLGVSRLDHLTTILGGYGDSMPITLVTPYGTSYSVIPTGSLDIDSFNPENPTETGTEFRVTLTLEAMT